MQNSDQSVFGVRYDIIQLKQLLTRIRWSK